MAFEHQQRKEIDPDFGMVEVPCHVLLRLGEHHLPLDAGVWVAALVLVVEPHGHQVAAQLGDVGHHLLGGPLVHVTSLDVPHLLSLPGYF